MKASRLDLAPIGSSFGQVDPGPYRGFRAFRAIIGGYLGGVQSSTLADIEDAGANRWGRAMRRMSIGALTLLVVAGALGAFGERDATVQATGDGYTLQVRYGAVSRAGLDTPLVVTVTHPGGFRGPVTLATSTRYLDLFESQGFTPEPASETTGDRFVYQQFDPPPGDRLRVSFDAYIQLAAQLGRGAVTALIVDGREVARVRYRTWLLP
jgi:hypothetical protein